MVHKIILISLLLLFTTLISHPAFCATQIAEYLCEKGINFYRAGRYDDALTEFKKALMLDHANQTAKTYINDIFQQEMPPTTTKENLVSARIKEEPILRAEITKEPIEKTVREEIMNKALDGFSKREGVIEKPAQKE